MHPKSDLDVSKRYSVCIQVTERYPRIPKCIQNIIKLYLEFDQNVSRLQSICIQNCIDKKWPIEVLITSPKNKLSASLKS